MLTRPIISSFPPITLSTNVFRWLHNRDWESGNIEYFYKKRLVTTQIIQSPPQIITPSRIDSNISARWTLNLRDTPDNNIAWAELQHLNTDYKKSFLYFDYEDSTSPELMKETLSLLISAIIIAQEPDLIYIATKSAIFKDWGKIKKIFLLPKDTIYIDSKDNILPSSLYEVIPSEWWNSSIGMKNKKCLAYLEKQVARMENKCLRRVKRRRSILSRIFKPQN